MKHLIKFFLITGIIIASIQLAVAVPIENDYGNVKAWYNSQEATVKNVKLKIGEPADIKVTVATNISGHVIVGLTNPLVTQPYQVIDGTDIDNRIDNYNVPAGWSKTFNWKIRPNGAWVNGNAPINILVTFYNIKTKESKKIEFTIADPYILDEQYTDSPSNPTPQPAASGTPAKPAPFPSVLIAVVMVLVAWRWMKYI